MRTVQIFGAARLPLYVFLIIFSQWGCANVSEGTDKENAENVAAVRAVLDAQVEAWNRGDVDGFMDGYAREDATSFVSGDTLTRGWQTVLERYRKAYDTPERMGKLEFTDLELKPMSPLYVLVTGRWQLARGTDAPRGRFTLVFRRTVGGWRIVHDHTSSASP